MTYALTAALQEAIYNQLSSDATLAALVDGVFDALPAGVLPQRYVQIGPEQARARSDKTGAGARHVFEVHVVGRDAGFLPVKQAAARVSDLLVDAPLPLTRGHIVSLRFSQAKATRDRSDDSRRITLRFTAQLYDI